MPRRKALKVIVDIHLHAVSIINFLTKLLSILQSNFGVNFAIMHHISLWQEWPTFFPQLPLLF